MARNPFTKRSPFGMLAMLLTGILTFAVIVFIAGEGIDFGQLEPLAKLMFAALGVMLVGLWLGLLHSLTGGLISLAGFAWFLSLEGGVSLGVVLYAFPVIAALFLAHALLIRTRPDEQGLTDADRRRARIRQVQREYEEKRRRMGFAPEDPQQVESAAGDPVDSTPPPPEYHPEPAPPPAPVAVQQAPEIPVDERRVTQATTIPEPEPVQPEAPVHPQQPAAQSPSHRDDVIELEDDPLDVYDSPVASRPQVDDRPRKERASSQDAPSPTPPPTPASSPGSPSLGSSGDGRASAPLPGWVPEDDSPDDDPSSRD